MQVQEGKAGQRTAAPWVYGGHTRSQDLIKQSHCPMQAEEGKADQAAAALAHLKSALAGTQAKRGQCGIQAMMAAELLAAGDAVAARHILTPVAGNHFISILVYAGSTFMRWGFFLLVWGLF